MLDPIIEFENDCAAAGVEPVAVLARAGMHRSNWTRWKTGDSSPTVRNFMSCREALSEMVGVSGAMNSSVPVRATDSAENPNRNVSRTDEPGSSVAGVAA